MADGLRGRAGGRAIAVVLLGTMLALTAGVPARATHEEPAARGIDTACPPARVPASGFDDIGGNPHRDAVECVAWWGVTEGRTATSYDPSSGVRRDQMASFLFSVLLLTDVDLPFDAEAAFEDVGFDNVHSFAVDVLADLGVVAGHADGTYRPGQRVRRDQMASFLSRAVALVRGEALADGHQRFVDVAGSNPHAAAVNGLAGAGIVQGRDAESGRYSPGLPVRRDQMASFLGRALDLLVEEDILRPPRAARAPLVDADGEEVGAVSLTEWVPGLVEVQASVTSLPPGFHGFHLHETGTCEPDFSAAGGHHNPDGAGHGGHAGDLPALLVGDDGTGQAFFDTDRVSVDGLLDEDGSAVIVHENPDNYANIPDRYGGPDEDTLATGDAGGRLACGGLVEAPVDRASFAGEPDPSEVEDIPPPAVADLANADGENVGSVFFDEFGDGRVAVFAFVMDLPPGFHGFHLHETGSCEPDFSAAGGHDNPGGAGHGGHAGDLPPLLVGEDGTGVASFVTDRTDVEELVGGDGSAVIVHENPDNYANIPDRYGGPDEDTLATGDAGGRSACGVIEVVEAP